MMKRRSIYPLILAGAIACLAMPVAAADFSAGEFEADGATLQYRLYDPSGSGKEEYPLVLFLHGEDGMGEDNEAQLTADVGAEYWADEIRQGANESYVLAPQINDADWTDDTDTVKALLDQVVAENAVDESRIYVVGLSSGGTGAWKLLLDYPEVFAGAIPVCGEVPAEYYETDAFDALVNMPIWAFHAADDDVVPESGTANAIAALQAAGSRATQYEVFSPGSVSPAHEVWYPAFIDVGTCYNFLMIQDRDRTEGNTKDPSMLFSHQDFTDVLTRVNDYYLGSIWVIDGGDQVVLIDTGMGGFGQADLYAYIRDNVIDNPDAEFNIVVTHSHGDHTLGIPSVANSGKLNKVYINPNDAKTVMNDVSRFGADIADNVEYVEEGSVIDINDIHLEVIDTPAHTPGSICIFYDDAVFTGDSIGSGYLWMFSYVDEVIPSAQHLVDEMEARGINKVYTGHFETINIFDIDYVKNIVACAQGIVDQTIPYGIYTRRLGAVATVGNASIFFNLYQTVTPEE